MKYLQFQSSTKKPRTGGEILDAYVRGRAKPASEGSTVYRKLGERVFGDLLGGGAVGPTVVNVKRNAQRNTRAKKKK